VTVPNDALPNVTKTLEAGRSAKKPGFFLIRHCFKSKRLCNPAEGNGWEKSNGNANVTISEDGLIAGNNTNGTQHIYAEKGFPISVADCRADGFPGTICYYFEVKSPSEKCVIYLIIVLYRETETASFSVPME
jgi:hypothetical protein